MDTIGRSKGTLRVDNICICRFQHGQFDATHVLGNILVISLVGIPLEQDWVEQDLLYTFIGLLGVQ